MIYSLLQTTSGGNILQGAAGLNWFNISSVFSTFDSILSLVIAFLTVIAGLWFLFTIIIGGIGIVTSAGNKQAIEDNRRKITTGLIGLIIVIAGVFLADIIGTILGLNILGPGSVLNTLTPGP